ncbi:MAG: AAA family ATPase [Elusimicrobiota bacterium]
MKPIKLSRIVACVLAISLVTTIPGQQAWALVAANMRPASAGSLKGMPQTPVAPGNSSVLPVPILSAANLSGARATIIPLSPVVSLQASAKPGLASPALTPIVPGAPAAALKQELGAQASQVPVAEVMAGRQTFDGSETPYAQTSESNISVSPTAAPASVFHQGASQRLSPSTLLSAKSDPNQPVSPAPEPATPSQTALALNLNAPSASESRGFVPAAQIVAELEDLLKSNPAQGLKQAQSYLLNDKEKLEVRIGALLAIETFPLAETLPIYQGILESAAKSDAQQVKVENKEDRWWFFQTETLRRINADGWILTPSEGLLSAVRSASSDYNRTVRTVAAEVSRKYGREPGPEPIFTAPTLNDVVPAESDSKPAGKFRKIWDSLSKKEGSSKSSWLIVSLGLVFSAILAAGSFLYLSGPAEISQADIELQNRIVAEQTLQNTQQAELDKVSAALKATQEQLAKEKAAARASSPSVQELKDIAQAVERIAKAQEAANNELRNMNESQAQAAAAKSGPGSWIMSALTFLLPMAAIYWVFKFMQRKGGGESKGLFSSQDNAVPVNEVSADDIHVTFNDIAGVDESMQEILEIIDYLKNPDRYQKMGIDMPKGILLSGPPGTGKTMMAKALAKESGAEFLEIGGSDFAQVFVGVGPARVRELFDRARKIRALRKKPVIIFVDEIDGLGQQRGSGPASGGDSEKNDTVATFLKEMDGFKDMKGIIVLGATNRPEVLDAAFVRPGRFDRKVKVNHPSFLGRLAILSLYARRTPLDSSVDLKQIARLTTRNSGADLKNVVNEAGLMTLRRAKDKVSMAEMDESVTRGLMGGSTTLKLDEKTKTRIAFHEAGHVLASKLNTLELRDEVNKLTILSRGEALGFAEFEGKDSPLYTRKELLAMIERGLGGLVAEKIVFDEWSSGPANDLEKVTQIARAMVQQFGMDDEMGLLQTSPSASMPGTAQPFGDAVASQVHTAAKKIVMDAYARVYKRLADNRDRLDALANAVLLKETLYRAEIDKIAYGELPQADGGSSAR